MIVTGGIISGRSGASSASSGGSGGSCSVGRELYIQQ